MAKNNKEIFHLSLSKDVGDFIIKYAAEKGINKSVAAERILLKGMERLNINDIYSIAEEVVKIIGKDFKEIAPKPVLSEQKNDTINVKENSDNNFNLDDENDIAMLSILDNIPD